MKTIIEYLNNMFAPLPKTAQLITLKDELLTNMEEKYNELRREGKAENEAIGIVISEFGNIDELLTELDIHVEEDEPAHPVLTETEVHSFLTEHTRTGKLIGIGVFLCILGTAILIFTLQLATDDLLFGLSKDASSMLGLIILLTLVAVAVGLFIYSGLMMEKYKHIEKSGEFELPYDVKLSIDRKNNAFQTTFTKSIILGVGLCILSPITLFIILSVKEEAILYGVVLLLLIISIAVQIFIYYGRIKDGYKKLLKMDEYSERYKKENKVIGAVAAIVWPLAVCIFLISGLMYNQWHINWIIFPITGLLFAMFSGAYSILKGED